MARFLLVALVVAALVGCGTNAVVATDSWPGSCPGEWRGDWQALANRTEAAVYCPRWLPWRFTGKITGNTVFSSVDPDGSYFVTFFDQTERHEAHMNMRGYPGRDSVPSCRTVETFTA